MERFDAASSRGGGYVGDNASPGAQTARTDWKQVSRALGRLTPQRSAMAAALAAELDRDAPWMGPARLRYRKRLERPVLVLLPRLSRGPAPACLVAAVGVPTLAVSGYPYVVVP